MGQIKTRKQKHIRNCPCPRKPPVPKTGGPLHVRPWTVPDYAHKRRQFLLRDPPREPQRCDYFGQKCTDVTETMRHFVPLHALHPNLINAPAPFHNRKVTSVTEYIAHAGKPRTGPVITTEGMPYHGAKATSITSYLRYVPPGHPAKEGHDAALPYHGIHATDVTGPARKGFERAEPTILTYMLPHRPKTAPTVVFPQHVSPVVLANALAERRRMFLEKPAMPNSTRGPEKPQNETAYACNTARSEPGLSSGGDARPKTAPANNHNNNSTKNPSVVSTPRPKTGGAAAASPASPSSTARSDRAAPPTPTSTPRPKAATDIQTQRPTTAAAADVQQTPRSQAGSVSSRSDRSSKPSSSNDSQGTPASISTTPRHTESSRGYKPTPSEILCGAAQRLGPEKLQRITNWTGHFEDPKPRMAWR